MKDLEVRNLLAFLKRNGAFLELHEDTAQAWAFALRNFEADAVKAAAMWFLERNHPREVAPATIAAAVKSLMASGRVQEPRCADHPEEIARACRCCAADVLTGERPRALRGRALPPAALAAGSFPTDRLNSSAGERAATVLAGRPVTAPGQLRAVDPARWDELHAQGAAQRAQELSEAPGQTQRPVRATPGPGEARRRRHENHQ